MLINLIGFSLPVKAQINPPLLPKKVATTKIDNQTIPSILELNEANGQVAVIAPTDHTIFIKEQNRPSSQERQIQAYNLTGRILNQKNGTGIANVNIFITNSSIGTATNSDGYFQLKDIPQGAFEIVITHISFYPTFLTKHTSSLSEIEVQLQPKTIELEELKVSSGRDKKWEKDLSFFKSVLLGQTFNATKCTIVNPWVLEFVRDEKQHTFVAKTNDLLIIENRALGYNIKAELVEFQVANGGHKYICKSFYEELEPESDAQEKKWKMARKRAYEGSINHFMDFLMSDVASTKNFEMSVVMKLPINEPVRGVIVEKKQILRPILNSQEKELHITRYLQVKYLKGLESKSYARYLQKNAINIDDRASSVHMQKSKNQTSWLQLIDRNMVMISKQKSGAIREYGYWAWKRLADDLPSNYAIN
jgi:predicted transcriptional regulator